MPAGQALLDAIIASGAIRFSTTTTPPFMVNYKLLRRVLRPEHAAVAAAGTPSRTDTGTMTFIPVGGGNPVTIPASVVIGPDGAPGTAAGAVANSDPGASGKILIAAGGDGSPPAGGGRGARGGDASVTGNAECLLIALGGRGGDAASPAAPVSSSNGFNGGDSGDAFVYGIGDANSCWAQAQRGGGGSAAAMGTPAIPGLAIPLWPTIAATPATPNGTSGCGGCGGDAFATSGQASLLDVRAGDRGIDGPVLPAFPPAAPPPSLLGWITYPPAAGNLTTVPTGSCLGGDATAVAGVNSSIGISAGLPGGTSRTLRR